MNSYKATITAPDCTTQPLSNSAYDLVSLKTEDDREIPIWRGRVLEVETPDTASVDDNIEALVDAYRTLLESHKQRLLGKKWGNGKMVVTTRVEVREIQ